MKIALFDPYLDTVGGGERYTATIAECLSQSHKVYFLWDDPTIKSQLEQTLNLDLDKAAILPNPFKRPPAALNRLFFLNKFDRLFYLSDGSIPFSFAKKNYLHFQFPVPWVNGGSFKTKFKLKFINKVICNSYFTKKFIDKTFGIESQVCYPPVDTNKFFPGKKEKIILSVGRFTKLLHDKKQEALIGAFMKFFDKGQKNWRLILAGGLNQSERGIMDDLKRKSKGYPIEILPNISFDKLKELYAKSTIFWHAAGLGVDTKKHPEKTEHFGITIVEAMSAGCIPIVVNNGGQKEIVEDGKSGFLYSTIDELVNKTEKIIEAPINTQNLSNNAILRSKAFDKETFCQRIRELMEI